MRQQLILDPLPPAAVLRALSPNGRPAHWTQRVKAKGAVVWAATEAYYRMSPLLEPMRPPVRLQMIWTFPQARQRDQDNLVAIGKCLQDFLVRKGILVGDHAEVLHLQPPVVQVERGVRRLTIVLESEEEQHALA